MKILLYGGSFDPPHNGHLNNLRAAADRVRPDKIVVMPAGTSPFKEGTNASGALRLEMCRCFAALAQEPGMPPLEVSGWEVAQAAAGSRNYTVLTLEMLARENPGAILYLAIGSDMLLSFEGWHRWQDILRIARVVVTSRDIGDAPALHAKAKQLDPSGGRILLPRCRRCLWPAASCGPGLPPERNAKPNCRKRCAPSSGGKDYTGTQKEVADKWI
ncbi:MAG: nicotinate-nicotinamide nucleotide adenylyltransferase [Faecalibacterium prausnitzii]